MGNSLGPVASLLLVSASACTTSLPAIKHAKYSFPPENAYVSDVMRPYDKLGLVKSRVDFTTLDPNREESDLCNNYYNKGVRDLLKRAREVGADAVIKIRTVVFLEDGHVEQYSTPECSDDGSEGQVLLEAVAIKWKPDPNAKPAPKPSPRAKKVKDWEGFESEQGPAKRDVDMDNESTAAPESEPTPKSRPRITPFSAPSPRN